MAADITINQVTTVVPANYPTAVAGGVYRVVSGAAAVPEPGSGGGGGGGARPSSGLVYPRRN